MLVYILKSVACLAILFVFYKVFLEKENMHKFKRFYLLGALVFSLIIPSLVFTEYVVVEPAPIVTGSAPILMQPSTTTEDVINVPPALEADVLDIEPLLWGVYFIGLVFFGLKFLRNLFQIYRRIRKNPKQKLSRFTQVLLQEKITPHTFFSYIFLNKKKFEADQIPAEVLLHEQTHASQKHSWDVILVEFLHVIFWINPFIYLTKKAIKLNHEFLADEAVLKKDIDKTTYQNTLLSYLSPDSEKKYQPLANAINYSSIKKRFTVMKTHTSKKAMLLRSVLLLPLLAILCLSFSETKLIEVEPEKLIDSEIQEVSNVNDELEKINQLPINYDDTEYLIAETIDVHLTKNGQVLVQDQPVAIENLFKVLSKYNSDLSREERSKIVGSTIHVETGALQKTIDRIQEILTEYGSATIDIAEWNETKDLEKIWISIINEDELWVNDQKVELDKLASKLSSISALQGLKNHLKIQIYSEETLHQNFLDKVTKEINKVGASNIQIFTEKYIVPEDENKTDKSSVPFKLKANKMIFETEGATKEQLYKYNTLAKKYNAVSVEKRSIPLNDLKVLETVFRKMTRNQKIENEPFPECLPEKTQKNGKKSNTNQKHGEKEILIDIKKNGKLFVQDELIPLEDLKNYLLKISPKSTHRKKRKFEYCTIFAEENTPSNLIEEVNSIVTANGVTRINILDPSNNSQLYINRYQGKATSKQLAEYNALAKHYNTMLSKGKSIRIKLKDVERLEYLHRQMSEEQKNNAEPFPDFPEPPPPPKEPNAPKPPKVIQGEASAIPPPPKEPNAPKVPKVHKGEVSDIPPPPAPPEPVSPLDYVIEMAKKDAKFYLEGKEITSDKAIEVMKKNKDLNIDSRASKGKRSVVKISTKPIRIN